MAALEGKVVLLTGGSRGIGPVLAEAMARRGASIALAARDEDRLRAVAARLQQQFGTRTLVVPVDLREQEQRVRLVASVRAELGAIDVLVNNAGLETEGAFPELSWDVIREHIEVNLIAPMSLTQLVLAEMLGRHAGHIVNIASIAAKSGAPYAAIYSGTKAGLAEWTRALRLELRDTGIRCSTIFPGYVRDVGMFAKFGVRAPWLVGSCSPAQVAEAVVDAIEKERLEAIVNSRPLRYVFTANELSPALGDWLMRVSGAVDFQRRKVGQR
ncbi:MAG: SDR family NAD(P)-dependent oxidoreductase [Gemmatimonadetes bacterium]|nr:SDR family NAD(P)-dependent oxidoreductase [Gemmatimonadota bacterium]